MNFKDILPLAPGSESQRRAHRDIVALNILNDLDGYDATHASSYVLGLDRPTSDIDIICEANDLKQFITELSSLYGHMRGFAVSEITDPCRAVVANFHFQDSEFEIFGQALPVCQQNGYRHMAQTARVIELGGEQARAKIRALRDASHKTEPAVALFLGLITQKGGEYSGNPFQELLTIEQLSDQALSQLVHTSLGKA
jgi:hypothetical protein